VIRCAGCTTVVGMSCVLLVACGAAGGGTIHGAAVLPAFFSGLNACLEKHGIAHPESSANAVGAEQTIPALVGTAGIPVPRGVAKVQYENALRRCGIEDVHVGRVPVTSSLLKHRIVLLRTCLANNGFALPAPNFSGQGAVLDTEGIDFASARWRATAMGCSVTRTLTKSALSRCMGDSILAGRATGASFEDRFLALPRCLH